MLRRQVPHCNAYSSSLVSCPEVAGQPRVSTIPGRLRSLHPQGSELRNLRIHQVTPSLPAKAFPCVWNSSPIQP